MEGFKVGVRNSPSGFPPVSALSTSLSLSSLSSLPRSLARSLPPAYRSCLSDKIGVLVLQLPRRVVSVLGTMYIPMFGRKSSNVKKKVQVTPPVIPIAKTSKVASMLSNSSHYQKLARASRIFVSVSLGPIREKRR